MQTQLAPGHINGRGLFVSASMRTGIHLPDIPLPSNKTLPPFAPRGNLTCGTRANEFTEEQSDPSEAANYLPPIRVFYLPLAPRGNLTCGTCTNEFIEERSDPRRDSALHRLLPRAMKISRTFLVSRSGRWPIHLFSLTNACKIIISILHPQKEKRFGAVRGKPLKMQRRERGQWAVPSGVASLACSLRSSDNSLTLDSCRYRETRG